MANDLERPSGCPDRIDYHPGLFGNAGEIRDAASVEFAQDMGSVKLNGFFASEEAACDLLAGQTADDQFENLPFAWREGTQLLRRLGVDFQFTDVLRILLQRFLDIVEKDTWFDGLFQEIKGS